MGAGLPARDARLGVRVAAGGASVRSEAEQGVIKTAPVASVSRANFPQSFIFGAATAAYQVEGAAKEDGRGASIWDVFSHTPGKTVDGDTGDLACDQYHRYQEDVELMGDLGVEAYRFSISWTRLFPNGERTGPPNPAGVAYYNRLIDSLLRKGIKPFVTLYHWDLPQTLHEDSGGWLTRSVVEHFTHYADACFEAFGDRVKHWITFNEPLSFCVQGYGAGIHAPGRCSSRETCPEGNSATEPYICAHHVLLAHAATVDIFKNKYKSQRGRIGITCDAAWGEPYTASAADIAAAQRSVEFQFAWFMDPLFFGDYPEVMREQLGERLPRFTPEEKANLPGKLDFVGLNHYTTRWIADGKAPEDPANSTFYADSWTESLVEKDGVQIGPRAASEWLYIVPWGIQKLLLWITKRYDRPVIYVTENGMDDEDDPALTLAEALQDTTRVKYYDDYLANVSKAIEGGADVQGYFAWSLLDNFEWAMGYSRRFGLFFVDYKDNFKRYPKLSAVWWQALLRSRKAKGEA